MYLPMTLLHSEREREGGRERGTEIPIKLEHRPQSIHSSYIIFNLYTMGSLTKPDQTKPDQPETSPRRGASRKINQRGGNNGGWGSWSIIAAAAAVAVAVVLFCWR